MTILIQRFDDPAERAAGARHFAHVADRMPDVGKKAIRRAELAEAAAVATADERRVLDALDRIHGADAFARALAPARRVQGRSVPEPVIERSSGPRQVTAADIADLEARVRADEAAAARPSAPQLQTRAAPPAFSRISMIREWVDACLADGSPDARKAGEILAERHGIKLEVRS